MIEITADRPSRTIRIFSGHAEQELENIRFWNAQPIEAKLRQTLSAIELAYSLKGIDVHTQGSNRFVVSFQRARG